MELKLVTLEVFQFPIEGDPPLLNEPDIVCHGVAGDKYTPNIAEKVVTLETSQFPIF